MKAVRSYPRAFENAVSRAGGPQKNDCEVLVARAPACIQEYLSNEHKKAVISAVISSENVIRTQPRPLQASPGSNLLIS